MRHIRAEGELLSNISSRFEPEQGRLTELYSPWHLWVPKLTRITCEIWRELLRAWPQREVARSWGLAAGPDFGNHDSEPFDGEMRRGLCTPLLLEA